MTDQTPPVQPQSKQGEPSDEVRRWTLIDTSETFEPRWIVVREGAPVAREYAEAVEVVEVKSGEGRK
jgi:hypothetical protein